MNDVYTGELNQLLDREEGSDLDLKSARSHQGSQ
jgi:hypothetical protein